MKNITLYILLLITLSNCKDLFFDSDCNLENIKIGEKFLTPNTKIFINQFEGKTIVYVDELGNESKFIEQDGLKRTVLKTNVRINCNTGWGDIDKSYDYIEYEHVSVRLTNLIENLGIYYDCRLLDRTFDPEAVYYEDVDVRMTSPCCTTVYYLIMSMRGDVNQPVIKPDPPIILDTIILDKHFTNIYKIKRSYCCDDNQPLSNFPKEFYFSKTDGIIAFTQTDGKVWRFDRME